MKLELKHLAPYLPYGLRFKTDFDHLEYLMTSLNIHKSKVTFRAINNFKNSKTKAVKLLGNNKPILRPLSDLTEDILKGIKRMMLVDFKYIDRDGIQSIHFPKGNICITSINYEIVDECSLGFYNYLLKHHFDVFGLIEQGLAIDINTL
jgi:hypothetical protein